ncbi:uncharacterized protein SPSK_09447 [Sporothrix schenckii 1099-18]|uniref:Pru domain-containing protein n=1 Tax=Sporothrix schenckii 1099-18 TaxID=1397361 RepID=A0A0F2M6S0_SPOSC|nr:uncharacterized protein SPSK_09447 [Sporothrix schenckii 1099-18]KJR84779.1 hypothetical protein SPSK_09447 [Sporothrix schenckii 1099-18]
MSIIPTITFKAGLCEVDSSSRPHKVKAQPEPGYIFLYAEDGSSRDPSLTLHAPLLPESRLVCPNIRSPDLMHFCWRPRDVLMDDAPLNLVMVPGDGRFIPYEGTGDHASSKTNGRIFVLKFESSSQRHLFWLQSKPQSPDGNPAWLSPRDRKIGNLVDELLQGGEPDIDAELAEVRDNNNDGRRGGGHSGNDGDGDETMEDAEDQHGRGPGGAGSGATGGDVREEGEDSREGGADGARAALCERRRGETRQTRETRETRETRDGRRYGPRHSPAHQERHDEEADVQGRSSNLKETLKNLADATYAPISPPSSTPTTMAATHPDDLLSRARARALSRH